MGQHDRGRARSSLKDSEPLGVGAAMAEGGLHSLRRRASEVEGEPGDSG